jgi:cysteine desulfurase
VVTAYLDHAASTPMRPEAVEAMMVFLTGNHANPSGRHSPARQARRALDDARDVIAAQLDAEPGGVVFTSGGTEADNLAVGGVLARRGGVAVCSAVEHHAVLEVVHHHGGRTVEVTRRGTVDLDALAATLGPEVSLVSVMTVNNETGVVQPLAEVAQLVRELAPNALLHTDAVQGYPWLDIASATAEADLVSLSAHKFGGPKGIGALVLRHDAEVAPLLIGGGQERERRSGTPNVAGAVAMAAAAAVTAADRSATVARIARLRDRLVDHVTAELDDVFESGVTVAGERHHKIAGTAHLCFAGVQSEELLFLLDHAGVCASAAASCASGAMEPSHVLAAMGVDPRLAGGALRLSLGWCTTGAEVDEAAGVVIEAVTRLRRRADAGTVAP